MADVKGFHWSLLSRALLNPFQSVVQQDYLLQFLLNILATDAGAFITITTVPFHEVDQWTAFKGDVP